MKLSKFLRALGVVGPAAGADARRPRPRPRLPDFRRSPSPPTPGGGQTYSLTLQVLILMTVLSLLPAILLMMTAFTRIVIVLAILRQAIGAGQTPPNQVLVGLALFLTFFVMAPVIDKVNTEAAQPYLAGTIETTVALERAIVPLKGFMLEQTRETDIATFVRISGGKGFAKPADVPLSILVPAFVTSELKTAFQIGFLLFIPVRDHRSRGGERAHVDGHDDAVAGADLPAVQDHVVRAHRRLGAGHGHARPKLLQIGVCIDDSRKGRDHRPARARR